MSQLLLLNPRKRRTARKASSKRRTRRTRSPAQRAATLRMLSARRGRRAVAHNPVRRRRRSKSYRRNPIGGRARRGLASLRSSGMTGMLKAGAVAGVGAVAVDIIFGQLARVLPPSMATPVTMDANGAPATNWMYYAAKTGVALAIGVLGKKVLPAKYAEAAAVGAISILAYSIARSFVPASLTMGAYMNPGRVMNTRRLNGLGAYQSLNSPNSARASNVSALNGRAMQSAFSRG